MKEKMNVVTNCTWIFRMMMATVEMVHKEIRSLCKFCYAIEPANEVHNLFSRVRRLFPEREGKKNFSCLLLNLPKFCKPNVPS
jgi:hypothetical protein